MSGITSSAYTGDMSPPPTEAPMFFRTASTYGDTELQERYDEILTIARQHVLDNPVDRERVRGNLGQLSNSSWLGKGDIGHLFSQALLQDEALAETVSEASVVS